LIVPEEISKRTLPLGYAFADFSRKRKVSASVGGMSPQNENLDAALFRGRSERFGTLLQTEDSANLPFVELRAPHRGNFLYRRKVKLRLTTKDTPKPPSFWISNNPIIGESSLSRFSGAMTAKFVFQ